MLTRRLAGFITFVIICAVVFSACGASGSIPIQEISTATPIPPTGTLEAGTQSEVATPNPTESDEVDSATGDAAVEAATEVEAATPLPQPTLGPLSPVIVGTIDFPGEPLPASEIPADLLDKVLADLQQRFSISRESIRVSRFDAIMWNDGSLGCPQPGLFYTQALVEGYWMILQADGVAYDYRASKKGYFFLCEQKLPGELRATAMPLQPVPIMPTAKP